MTRTEWRHRGTFFLAVAAISGWPGANAQDRGTDACLALANESAQRGDLRAAESKTRECLRLAPDAASVLAYLGVILTKQDRLSEANPYLEKAIRIDASRTSTRFNLALNEFRLGNLESAAGNLESVLQRQPDHGPAALLLGTILAQKGECQRAVALLEPVGELARRQPDSVAALSRCYYVTGQRNKARHMLGALVEQSQGPEWIVVGAGVALQANDPETAESLLSAARSQYPNDPRVTYGEALVQYNAGRFAESQATLERSIAAGVREPDVFDLLAWCWHRQAHELEAAQVMQQAIQLEPSSAIRYTHLAQMLLEQENYSKAFVAAQKATELPAAGAAAWRVRATVEFAMSMFKQAANSAAKAVDLDPHDPDPLLLLGAAQQKLFRYAEAKATLEKGMRLFPDQARFSLQYGKLLLDPGGAWGVAEQASGVALLESALARDGSLFEAHLALGHYLVRTGSAVRALPHLAAAVKLSPRDAQAHLLLASAYRLAGRPADAAEEIRLYRTLQTTGPAASQLGDEKPVPHAAAAADKKQ
jgi:superkiller protein 3